MFLRPELQSMRLLLAAVGLDLRVIAAEGRNEENTGLCNAERFLPPPLLAIAKATRTSISPNSRDFFSMWLSLA
jgi:hypothetical protein